ncbi:hypothetical protein [Promicromonospora sp. NPDC057488]|uniref:hypothetical protein n=1 Tax=Promicromonospora sp. NPDC057488 TaxID=3346147 RepID=UPI00366C3E80
MTTRTSFSLIIGGAAVAVLGVVVSVVYLLQPWRTCPDDTSPAACPMLAQDATVLAAALVVTVLAAAVTVVGLVLRRR